MDSESDSQESEPEEDPLEVEAERLRQVQAQKKLAEDNRKKAEAAAAAASKAKRAKRKNSKEKGKKTAPSVTPAVVSLDDSIVMTTPVSSATPVKQPEVAPAPSRRSKRRERNSSSDDQDSEEEAKNLIMKVFKDAAKKSSKKKKSKSKKRRRRASSSSSSGGSSVSEDDEEIIEETFTVRDDGISDVNMEIRHKFRPPTGDPAVWWKPPFKSEVSRPVRGASINLEASLGHGRIHEATVRRVHHRTAVINVKMLLSKNADISIRDDKEMTIAGDKVVMNRKWSGVDHPWEIAEAVSNLVTLVHYVRAYSYEAIALQRALHDYGKKLLEGQCLYVYLRLVLGLCGGRGGASEVA